MSLKGGFWLCYGTKNALRKKVLFRTRNDRISHHHAEDRPKFTEYQKALTRCRTDQEQHEFSPDRCLLTVYIIRLRFPGTVNTLGSS